MTPPRQTGSDFGDGRDFDQILTNPFLDIAARFWDERRYEAFRVCYRSMRLIDDLVDERKVTGEPLLPEEQAYYRSLIYRWLDQLRRRRPADKSHEELLALLGRFAIPLWPWERLCHAMIYDLDHDGFATFRVFLRYAEGAAIAPASVFVHLCGVVESGDDHYRSPSFDIRKAARPLALFSYLVHIMRDFQKDQLRGLNYFAEDLLAAHSLGLADMRRAAEGGPIPQALRDLLARYRSLADYYRSRARVTLDRLAGSLEPRYRLSLEVIYGLYHLVFERIDSRAGSFSGQELNPPSREVQRKLQAILADFKADKDL